MTTASTPTWRTANIAQNAGQIWIKLAIPGAAARLTLHSDGTPDATTNTTAMHLGATKAGSKLMIKSTLDKFHVDEFRAPVVSNISDISMGISAELVGVTSLVMLTEMLPGVATYATTPSSFSEIRIGVKAITYTCAACIFPLIEDTSKFGVFNIYSSLNDTGVEWAQARKDLGFTPISLVGYEITTRAVTDTLGAVWKQIASSDT